MTQTLPNLSRTATDTILTVEGLSRTYGSTKGSKAFTAVDDISFTVRGGEVFGLLGTNGAGKTSTLEMLEGLARPTRGTVRIYGLDPYSERKALRPELGIMLQDGGLPASLTVAETMRMWAGTCSTPRPVDEVLADVSLAHRAEVKVGSLSGGEQRRLDLACALLGDPSVLFLDEPTTGLDPESRRQTWDLLLGLKERGVTMLLTTHYLEEAEYLADRIAIMHDGRIVREGSLAELVADADSEITFHAAGAFPAPPGTQLIREDGRHTLRTARLQEDALAVLEWAREHDFELEGFAARPASLESVFLAVAGDAAHKL